MKKIITVLLTVMLASLGSARSVPYVPAVVHPPIPEEGKYEEAVDSLNNI
jgi:hypothetical protein